MSSRKLSQNTELIRNIRQELAIFNEKRQHLLSDKRLLMEKIQYFNTRAVACIESHQYQPALLYLESAEQLLQSSTEKGEPADPQIIQCVLQNQACCFQNMWQLEQCSNYIEALIFNLNSKKKQNGNILTQQKKEENYCKFSLAKYYLQFCAVNSQLGNHSGGLISARKALTIIRKQLSMWQRLIENKNVKIRNRADYEQKYRLLDILCNFNDHINLQLSDNLLEATAYFLKIHYINLSGSKSCGNDVRYLIQNFSMKTIMQIQSITYQNSSYNSQKDTDLSLFSLYERVFILSTCYFTMATELRLIAISKVKDESGDSRNNNKNIENMPQFKESQIFHLFAILVLVLTINIQSQFLGHLLSTYFNHYNTDIGSYDVPFKKIFTQIITEPKTIRQTSIMFSEEEGLISHLSKGRGTYARFTKSSKHSDQYKFSLIDPNKKKNMTKSKSKNKSKKKESSSKTKKQSSSLSKSPFSKSPRPKDSKLLRSPKSKQHIKWPMSSLKQISNPIRTKLARQVNERDKTHSKSRKKGAKNQHNQNEYFLERQDEKKNKKTSVSSKKNSTMLQTKSTSKLPLNSTLQIKEVSTQPVPSTVQKQKKKSKRNLLQHYL